MRVAEGTTITVAPPAGCVGADWVGRMRGTSVAVGGTAVALGAGMMAAIVAATIVLIVSGELVGTLVVLQASVAIRISKSEIQTGKDLGIMRLLPKRQYR